MPNGIMTASLRDIRVAGSRYDTICINYNFPSGVTSTGDRYPSEVRDTYLEASPEGYQILELLKKAFERRLTFTIGDSITTGMRNVIVWNGIHHKTTTGGGPYGFPDPTYYQRVRQELASKGVL